MSNKRKTHNAAFKAKIALAAYKDDQTAAELISQYKISSGQTCAEPVEVITVRQCRPEFYNQNLC